MRSKAAGIRFVSLALAALAALVVFGCGGGSATKTASTPATSSTAEGGGGTGQQKKPSPSKSDNSADSDSTSEKSASKAKATEADSTSPPGKQGTAITPPKGPREPEPSAQERAEATVVSMSLTSPALTPGPESVSPLPATYTCDGKDTWPTLKWAGVPADTAELVLFVLNIEPVGEALFFDWALSGVDPALGEIKSGQLPKGAVPGKNSFGKTGYSVCPAKSPETVIFALYALPEGLSAHKGFDPAALRKEVLDTSANAGLLATSYSHG